MDIGIISFILVQQAQAWSAKQQFRKMPNKSRPQ
jgi:hypothetical protein